MPRELDVTEELIGYLGRWGARTDEVLERVRAETAVMPSAQMQVGADQASHRCAVETGDHRAQAGGGGATRPSTWNTVW